jgi:cell division protein ZapA
MKQVEVTILGQGYLLACPDDGEEQLMAAVAAVDREMSAIRDGGKVKARDRIAVLAALAAPRYPGRALRHRGPPRIRPCPAMR